MSRDRDVYVSNPSHMDYFIHGNQGYNGKEREPHCHVYFSREQLTKVVKVSLDTGRYIEATGVTSREIEEAEDFVRAHLYDLKEEWKRKRVDN